MENLNQNQPKKEKPKKKNKIEVWIAIAVAIIVAIVAIGYFTDFISKDTFNKFLPKNSENMTENNKKKVAVVNEEAIYEGELEARINQINSQAGEENQITEDQKKQVLQQLIDEVLLYQKAKEEGFTVNSQEVESQYQQAKQQFENEEQFKTALQENNLTEEAFKSNLERNIILDQYIEKVRDDNEIEVTDEEIQNFYNQNVEGQEQAPELSQVEDQIRQSLAQQKVAQLVDQIINEYEESSDIEILI